MPISQYLARIRERVGHDLVLVPAVAVLPWDESGRLLHIPGPLVLHNLVEYPFT